MVTVNTYLELVNAVTNQEAIIEISSDILIADSDSHTPMILNTSTTVNGNGNTITIDSDILTFTGLFILDDTGSGTYNINYINVVYSGATSVYGSILDTSISASGAYTLNVDKCSVTGTSYTIANGGIIGRSAGNATDSVVTISNCYCTGGSFTNINCGYICGGGTTATISNCFSTGEIGTSNSGGITGRAFNGTITDCYSLGKISGLAAGGICGRYVGVAGFPATITNCYSAGNITSAARGGGIAGRDVYAIITNCYSVGTIAPYVSNGAIIGEPLDKNPSILNNCFGLNAVANFSSGSINGLVGIENIVGFNNTFYGSGLWTGSDNYLLSDGSWTEITNISPPVLTVFTESPWIEHIEYTSIDGFLTEVVVEVKCFVTGTMILTSNGEVRIETLNVGDKIQVSDGRDIKIKQISIQKINNQINNQIPYCIKTGFFSNNEPNKDLYISGTHLIKPKNSTWTCPLLIDKLKQIKTEGMYYNLVLENYNTDIIVANGIKCDSMHLNSESIYYMIKDIPVIFSNVKTNEHVLFVNS